MNTDAILLRTHHTAKQPFIAKIHRRPRDLIVLRYMVRRVVTMLQQPDTLFVIPTMKQPLLYVLQERRSRTHRIALYQTQESFMVPNLFFVGFFSKKQSSLHPQVIEDIAEVDKKLLVELIDTPGLLSYSSLQLHNGNWCNLVLFRDVAAKIHLRSTTTHTYAAYQLAPRYYEWIRLHNGSIDGELAQGQLILQKTHLYIFPTPHGKPIIQELTYTL